MANNLIVLLFGGVQGWEFVDDLGNTNLVEKRPNPSMQVGDTIYKVSSQASVGGVTTADVDGSSTIKKVGVIKRIQDWNDGNGGFMGDFASSYTEPNGGTWDIMSPSFIDLSGDGESDVNSYTYFPFSSSANSAHSYAIIIENPTYAMNDVPTTSDYFFFSKDNGINLTSITGYYAEVEFKNNSTEKAELFATSCDITESSK